MTDDEIRRLAVEAALGHDPGPEHIDSAVQQYTDVSLDALRRRLRIAVRKFDRNGGRGVELADEIDSLRIAIAARAS